MTLAAPTNTTADHSTGTRAAPPAPAAPEDESTGLPGLRRWPTAYAAVTLLFILWVVLLAVFCRVYS